MRVTSKLAIGLLCLSQWAGCTDPVPLSVFHDRLEDGSQGPDMVVIPAGEFVMGATADEPVRTSQLPQHSVRMQAFALGRTEVTVAQFRRFIESTGYRTDAEGQLGGCLGGIDEILPTGQFSSKWAVRKGETWRRSAIPQDATHPVVCVSFRDAAAYAEWLSKQTGEAYRLPNEAEWEYAARAGTTTRYSTGNCLSSADANITDAPFRNFANCPSFASFKGTKPVATYAPNPFGVYDMYGNAEEWTADCWHEDYQQAPQDGRTWMNENRGDCSLRAIRGGSWRTMAIFARAGYRAPAYVHTGDYETGFRLVRTL